MRAVVQRVSEANVEVGGETIGKIGPGLLVLLAIHQNDSQHQLNWMADKLVKLRIFEDDKGKMNKSVADTGGEILLVSQFTLYGELKKGTRPSFIESAKAEKAEEMMNSMEEELKTLLPGKIKTGKFAAKMRVSLLNNGPVTIILDK